uniref:Uncharacterized protein n=1 Tax=Arundo donax TaxID=35708 RepID=A0A0A9G3U1_ARUDO
MHLWPKNYCIMQAFENTLRNHSWTTIVVMEDISESMKLYNLLPFRVKDHYKVKGLLVSEQRDR